jgi:O-antigen/teichoic acid export membrane protein
VSAVPDAAAVVVPADGVRGRERIVRDSAQLALRTVLQQLLTFARGLVLPNILGPLHYGSLATVLLIERYSTPVNLGLQTATLYQAPRLLMGGRFAEARRIHDVVVSVSASLGCLAGLLVLGGVWWAHERLGPELTGGLLVAALVPPLIVLRGAFMTWTRANQDFTAVSRAGILSAVALFGLTIALGWWWKTTGAVVGHVIAHVLLVGYLYRRAGVGVRFTLPVREILSLVRFSAPISIALPLPLIYLATADRLTIATVLSVEDVGFYAIGQALAGVLTLLPGAVGEAIGTTLIVEAQRGRSGQQERMYRVTMAVAVLVGLLGAVAIATIPGLVHLVFPRYQAGILVAQLLCVAAYFEAVGLGAHYVVTGKNRVGVYIIYAVVLALIAYVTLPIVCRQAGIAGVAVTMIVLTAARTLWLVWMADTLTRGSRRAAFHTVGLLFGIGAVMTAVSFAVRAGIDLPAGGSVVSTATATGARVAVTVLVLVTLGMVAIPSQMRLAWAGIAAALPARLRRARRNEAGS